MSLSRNELKDIESLQTKKGRKEHQLFFAEGVRVLEEALKHHRQPELILCSPSRLDDRARTLMGRFGAMSVRIEELNARPFAKLSDVQTPQALLGLFPIQFAETAQLMAPDARKVLLCDSISDPGNLGTLIRSALAFEFDQVLLTGPCADPFSPKVVRATAGAIFGVTLSQVSPEALPELKSSFEPIMIGADPAGQTGRAVVDDADLGKSLILAIGSEAEGLDKRILELCDIRMKIEHDGKVESLNAAVAGSILMQEIYNLAR